MGTLGGSGGGASTTTGPLLPETVAKLLTISCEAAVSGMGSCCTKGEKRTIHYITATLFFLLFGPAAGRRQTQDERNNTKLLLSSESIALDLRYNKAGWLPY